MSQPTRDPALDEFVRRAVEAAPPLTPEQRDRLNQLLRRPRVVAGGGGRPRTAGAAHPTEGTRE